MGVQNFEFNIFGGFQKNEDYVDIFFFWGRGGVITKLDYMGHFCAFWGLKVKVQNGGYFLGLLKFKIFFWGARNS